ncbi:MAG: hypothetical protein WCG66_09950 [bacterium]
MSESQIKRHDGLTLSSRFKVSSRVALEHQLKPKNLDYSKNYNSRTTMAGIPTADRRGERPPESNG